MIDDIFNYDENYCYSCGLPIESDFHFCDIRCSREYFSKIKGDNAKVRKTLGQQSLLRKRLGFPRYIKK